MKAWMGRRFQPRLDAGLLLQAADPALYHAKRLGRNRVEAAIPA